jgi:hypothetical protein
MARGDAKQALIAAIDTALTAPVAARTRAAKWSDATCKEYLAQVKQARAWWENERRESRELAREAGLAGIPAGDAAAFMPWSSDRLVRYVQHLAECDLAVATIRKALTALKAWHRLHGLPVPDGLPASEALQRHDASLREAGRPPKHAEPVTLDVALRMLAATARDLKTVRGTRDGALLCLAFAGMATPAVLVGMNRRDVETTEHGLRVRRGDQGAAWVDVDHWYAGDEHEPSLCPVERIAAWCGYLDTRDVAGELPLLRGVDQHGNVSGLGAFAGLVDGFGRLDDKACGSILRRVAGDAGVDPAPTMTELRIGGIVRSRVAGAPVAQLAEQSGVASLLRYVVLAESEASG